MEGSTEWWEIDLIVNALVCFTFSSTNFGNKIYAVAVNSLGQGKLASLRQWFGTGGYVNLERIGALYI